VLPGMLLKKRMKRAQFGKLLASKSNKILDWPSIVAGMDMQYQHGRATQQ
jgi:hypothetical protein